MSGSGDGLNVSALRPMRAVPAADADEQDDRDQRQDRERQDRALAERNDDKGRQERSGRLAEIPADLEEALGETVAAAGGRARHPRRLGVEDGAADADHRDRHENELVRPREGEQSQTDQREAHADRQDPVHRPPVGRVADEGLQQRGGDLEDERDHADLEEAQAELAAEHRIERRRQRLHDVVEHVRSAERRDHADRGRPDGLAPCGGGFCIGWRCRQSPAPLAGLAPTASKPAVKTRLSSL